MGEHTRAPWHAYNIEDRWDGNISAVVSTGPNTGKLVTIARHVSADDARLIAAAPALLAALEQISNADSNQSPLNVTACYEAMKAIAQAALSAASGRAPTNKES